MKNALVLLLVSALMHVTSACKRKQAPGPETHVAPEAAANTPAPGADVTAAPAKATPASAPATGIAQSKPGASENTPLNGELTDAVARFRDKHKRLPASWQELVQTGFLKALPQPPPGVRYAIDPVSAMVVEQKTK